MKKWKQLFSSRCECKSPGFIITECYTHANSVQTYQCSCRCYIEE
jgi:hypothetical protein